MLLKIKLRVQTWRIKQRPMPWLLKSSSMPCVLVLKNSKSKHKGRHRERRITLIEGMISLMVMVKNSKK